MLDFDLNWWAVLVAVVWPMALGYAWYSKGMFGARWMQLIGKNEEDLKKGQGSAMFSMIVFAIITAIILANVVSWAGAANFMEGLLVGLWVWLAFTFAFAAVNAMYEQKNMAHVWITTGFALVVSLVNGGIFAAWV